MTHIFQLGFLSHLIAFLSLNGDNMRKQRLHQKKKKGKYPIDFQLYFTDINRIQETQWNQLSPMSATV